MTRYWSGPKSLMEIPIITTTDRQGRTVLLPALDLVKVMAEPVPCVPLYEPPAQRVDENGNPIRLRVVLTR